MASEADESESLVRVDSSSPSRSASQPPPIASTTEAAIAANEGLLATAVAGYSPDGSTPEVFGKQVQDDVQRYGEILRKFNIKAE